MIDLLTNSFLVLFIILGAISVISIIGWGIAISDYCTKLTIKVWKCIFLFAISITVLLFISSFVVFRTIEYKIPTAEIMSGSLISENGQNETYYRWNDQILPNMVRSHLFNTDTLTMLKILNPWAFENNIELEFIISNEKPVKKKPKIKIETPNNIKIK